MSIASEITSIGENLKKDYQSIANLGADLTNVDKNIENIAELLDGVYDNLPKTEYTEGTEVNLGKTSKGKLDFAKEYQEVEYIESTGTQYIDTGVIGKNLQTSFECKCTFSSVYGGSAVNSTGGLHYILDGDATLRTGGAPSGYSYTLNKVITIKAYYDAQNRRALDVDGTLACTGSVYNSSDANILIFRLADTSTQKGRMYWFKIYTNGVLVFDGIPCYRISDNVIGLYDKIESKFYTNAGTGTFTKGADVGSGFNGVVGIGQSSQDGTPTPSTPIAINSVTGNQDVVVKDGNNNTIATYQLSLGDIELNAIGNYKDELIYDVDEDKVYKNSKIWKKNITDSSAWEDYSAYWGACSFGITKTIFEKQPIAWSDMYSKYFKAYTTSQTKNLSNEIVIGSTTLIVNNKETSTLSAFRNWLASNPFYIYYQLATAVKEEITGTLKDQVKALYNAHSLNGTTIITSNGNLPMIIKVRGLKGE